MQQNGKAMLSGKIDSVITCKTSQGVNIKAPVLRLTRHAVVFDIDDSNCVLRNSEVLDGVEINMGGHTAFSGRAVVSSAVNTGTGIICEAGLKEGWNDLQPLALHAHRDWPAEFSSFLRQWEKNYKL